MFVQGASHRCITACFLLVLIAPISSASSQAYTRVGQSLARDRAIQVAAGGAHTCALTTTNEVMCWGANWYGQLGDGTTTDRYVPVNVSELNSDVVAVATGDEHTCVITGSGGVKCWGENYSGQLGDGTTASRYRPVDVNGLTNGVKAITAGYDHTCALTNQGGVKCWGANQYGGLGDGTTTYHFAPIDVSGLSSGVKAVVAGRNYTCALTNVGGVKCWGNNSSGELGDGTTVDRYVPTDVSELSSGVIAIALGSSHACALLSTGNVKCWGNNSYGQLGDGTTIDRITPTSVNGLTGGISVIAAGSDHTCALTVAGRVKCWGSNKWGQLGDGTAIDHVIPVLVSGLNDGVLFISTSAWHTCVVTGIAEVKCWGSNSIGQLGNGMITDQYEPVNVNDLSSGETGITTGYWHTCALINGGTVKCWGDNEYGELGDATNAIKYTPVNVKGLNNGVIAIAAGSGHTCALTSIGRVKCWGRNEYGELGDGTAINRTIPITVTGLSSEVAAIAAGAYHTCALTIAGGVKCWGYNYNGQLGSGLAITLTIPADVIGLNGGVVAIVAGGAHTCALTTAGGVKCWGYNYDGELGDGTTTDRYVPADVIGLTSGVVAIAAGGWHTCALTTAGGVKCWGYNYNGQLGDGTVTHSTVPAAVSGLSSGVVGVTAGDGHTCALTSAGEVKCWGWNISGQIGDGTNTSRYIPTSVNGLGRDVINIAAGYEHTCALTSVGAVKCWGDNSYGQLGVEPVLVPVRVKGFGSDYQVYLPITQN